MLLSSFAVALVVVPGLASARTGDVDGFRWEGRMKQGQAIEIKNTYGSIRAEPASGNRVEVIANKPGTNFIVVETECGVSIRAVASEEAEAGVRVDFSVRVPKGVRFVGRTVNGSVEAESLQGDAAGYTVNGDVRLSTMGQGEAGTVNGSITASLGATRAFHNLKFSSVNGGITVRLPRRWSASLAATTRHGEIASDVPLLQRGAAAGHAALQLSTVNGNIRVRRGVS